MNPWTYAKAGCSEHASQVALFMWAKMAFQFGPVVADDPRAYGDQSYSQKLALYHGKPIVELKWLFAIPNGGERTGNAGAVMRAEGQKPGVADCFLPVPRDMRPNDDCIGFTPKDDCQIGILAGLFIEMKKDIYRKQKDGGLSSKQLDFKSDMVSNGYAVVVCYTWLEARNAIMQYLGLETNVRKGLSEV